MHAYYRFQHILEYKNNNYHHKHSHGIKTKGGKSWFKLSREVVLAVCLHFHEQNYVINKIKFYRKKTTIFPPNNWSGKCMQKCVCVCGGGGRSQIKLVI